MEIKCLECGKPVPQTFGKRKKEYCNSTCRTKFWKKKKDAGKEKKGPGRPKKAFIDPKEIQKKIAETKEKLKNLPILYGPIKEILVAASEETAKLDIETAITPSQSMRGTIIVADPLKAAALARHPKNASAKDEVPFPDNWDKMGKIQRLEWLTANPRK